MSSWHKWEKRMERTEKAGSAFELLSGHMPSGPFVGAYKRLTNHMIMKSAPPSALADPMFKRIMAGRNLFLAGVGLTMTGLAVKHLLDQRNKHGSGGGH